MKHENTVIGVFKIFYFVNTANYFVKSLFRFAEQKKDPLRGSSKTLFLLKLRYGLISIFCVLISTPLFRIEIKYNPGVSF